jgi:hypothetical protein
MEKKYYTPDISEFYVGFECEFKDLSGNFIPIVHTEESISYKDTFRVKCLDKEDIENLGFKLFSDVANILQFEKSHIDHYYNILIFDRVDRELSITEYSYKNKDENIQMYEITRFDGFIKNKSELKKLLKWLNIDYNE